VASPSVTPSDTPTPSASPSDTPTPSPSSDGTSDTIVDPKESDLLNVPFYPNSTKKKNPGDIIKTSNSISTNSYRLTDDSAAKVEAFYKDALVKAGLKISSETTDKKDGQVHFTAESKDPKDIVMITIEKDFTEKTKTSVWIAHIKSL
jgi:hypothetical protein